MVRCDAPVLTAAWQIGGLFTLGGSFEEYKAWDLFIGSVPIGNALGSGIVLLSDSIELGPVQGASRAGRQIQSLLETRIPERSGSWGYIVCPNQAIFVSL